MALFAMYSVHNPVDVVVLALWMSLLFREFSHCKENNSSTSQAARSTSTTPIADNLLTLTSRPTEKERTSTPPLTTKNSSNKLKDPRVFTTKFPTIPVHISLDEKIKNVDQSLSTNTYDTWFTTPAHKNTSANLAILPILAILAFLIAMCLKGCTWFRESIQDKELDMDDEDAGFIILTEGDKEYHDIDLRSNLSTPYDTYSSYMSFLRRNNNTDTLNSIRSFQNQVFRPYDTVTSYRSLLMQRLDCNNGESINSYRAFLQLQQASQMKDVEIQVELLTDKSKYEGNANGANNASKLDRQPSISSSRHAARPCHHTHETRRDGCTDRSPTNSRDKEQAARLGVDSAAKQRHDKNSFGNPRLDRSPISQNGSHSEKQHNSSMNGGHSSKPVKFHRFKVSFVMNDMAEIQTSDHPALCDGSMVQGVDRTVHVAQQKQLLQIAGDSLSPQDNHSALSDAQ